MTASSPAFYRTLLRRAALRNPATAPTRRLAPATSARPFTQSSVTSANKKNLSTDDSVDTSMLPDDEHTISKTKKGDTLDVQSEYASKGMDAKKNDTGGAATEQRDSQGAVKKAKKDFPEAPDPAIGMQDERGTTKGA